MLILRDLSAQAFAGFTLILVRQTLELVAPVVTLPSGSSRPSLNCVSAVRPRDLIALASDTRDPQAQGPSLGVRPAAKGFLGRQIRRRQKAHEAVGHDAGCAVFGMSQQLLKECCDRLTAAPAAIFVLDAFQEAAAGVIASSRAGWTVTAETAYTRLEGEIRLRITPDLQLGGLTLK